MFEKLEKRVRGFYLLAARLVRTALVVFAAHFLIKGDLEAVTGLAVAFLICDAQVRVTRLEQEADSDL